MLGVTLILILLLIICKFLVSYIKRIRTGDPNESNLTNKKELEKIILIKIPQEIYPTIYETFVYLFKQAGIKNIEIHKKVDFEKMYNERKI